jgi:hypothetical protein
MATPSSPEDARSFTPVPPTGPTAGDPPPPTARNGARLVEAGERDAPAGKGGPAPPLAIPGYRVREKLGAGGMGAVYLAEDLGLPRLVALKVLRGGAEVTPEQLNRFRAEAEAVARLNHPHVVQIYALDRWQPPGAPEPLPYFAMEFVPGGTLAARLAQGKPATHEGAHLVEVLARTMHALHRQGVVHRDLKPANVLLAPPVEGSSGSTAWGWPKISDFGLVKCLGDSKWQTQTGVVLGTPGYLAPEQAEGRKDVGPAADTWALGAIFYECLAGRRPFRADTTFEVLMQTMHSDPIPPRQVCPGVPAELEAICLRCLRKHPAERYESAGALADDLRRWLDDGAAARPEPAPSASRWPPQPVFLTRRLFLAAGGLAGVLAVGGVAGWWWLSPGNRPPGNRPPLPPFKGYIDIVMTRPGDAVRQRIRLDDPASRPLQVGDQVRVIAKVYRPGYLYVLWIDAQGEVLPVYPWLKGDWKRRRQEQALAGLDLPEESETGGIPIEPDAQGKNPQGMESLLLLVRETPLPGEVDLAKLLAGLEPQERAKEEDLLAVAWFENGQVVQNEKERKPNLKDIREADNPLLRLQRTLHERLSKHFAYTRAVMFGNRAGG